MYTALRLKHWVVVVLCACLFCDEWCCMDMQIAWSMLMWRVFSGMSFDAGSELLTLFFKWPREPWFRQHSKGIGLWTQGQCTCCVLYHILSNCYVKLLNSVMLKSKTEFTTCQKQNQEKTRWLRLKRDNYILGIPQIRINDMKLLLLLSGFLFLSPMHSGSCIE